MTPEIDAVVQEAADEATEALEGDTRLGFLKKAGLAGGGLVGGGALLIGTIPAIFLMETCGRRFWAITMLPLLPVDRNLAFPMIHADDVADAVVRAISRSASSRVPNTGSTSVWSATS